MERTRLEIIEMRHSTNIMVSIHTPLPEKLIYSKVSSFQFNPTSPPQMPIFFSTFESKPLIQVQNRKYSHAGLELFHFLLVFSLLLFYWFISSRGNQQDSPIKP